MKKKKREIEKPVKEHGEKLQNIATSLKDLFTGGKTASQDSEYIQRFNTSRKSVILPKHSKYSKMEKITFGALGIIIINILVLAIRYIYAFTQIRTAVITNNPFYIVIAAILPYVMWVFATNENFWAFHKRKRQFFAICTINITLVLCQPVYSLIAKLAVLIVGKIPINPLLTIRMVYLIGYIVIIALMALFLWILYIQFEPLLLSENLKKEIELFKLQNVVDDRENRDYKYDFKVIKDLETGKPVTVRENDRYTQTAINGASGTGKTSTIFEGGIRDDLDQKVKNREKRQEALLAMIEKKQAYIKGPLREFEECAVMPAGATKVEIARNQKKLDKIRKKYPDCGMTIVAPNNAMIEDIVKMAAARNVFVNVIDPVNNYEAYPNVRIKNINPFFIKLGLTEDVRILRIAEAASVFSDVLIATNQMGGESDVYFTDISLSVSSNISSVVMLAKNIMGQQTYIDDVQECVNDFQNLNQYIQVIEKEFGEVEAGKATTKGGKVDAEGIHDIYVKGKVSLTQKAAARKNPYYYQILFVKQELLGSGSEDMFSQARGLRNLINKIMGDPRIKRKLSADDESRIDFDKILYNNEITVVNTAIELGKNISTSFGLFFLLTHQVSVLRRPIATRTPHFLWVDECAQYVHPFFDNVIALYRQYKVPAVLTLQTLTQLEKSNATAYLKNVFLGAGTHIVFGRLAPEEMKLYSEMSGVNRELMEQKTTSENSIFTSNPNYSESVRTTPNVAPVLEGADMRILGFLELTIFTVNNGRVLPGQLGRVFFVGQDAFDEVPYTKILWEKLAPEAFKQVEETKDDENNKKAEPFTDKIPEDITTEHILTQSMPKQEKIENKAEEPLTLNSLYLSLMSEEEAVQVEEAEDIDYAAASREFNKRRYHR